MEFKFDEPVYTLRLKETVSRSEYKNKAFKFIGILFNITLVLTVVTALFSILVGDNIIDGGIITTLLCLSCISEVYGRHIVNSLSDIEFMFYDSYMIIHRPCKVFKKFIKLKTRVEINKISYSDLSQCAYNTQFKRLTFYGIIEQRWYRHNSLGSCSRKPYHNKKDNSLVDIRMRDVDNIDDIIRCIESYIKVKVDYTDSINVFARE